MATNKYRANLTSAMFPMLSELQGQNIIISNIDQNFSRQVSSSKDKDRDVGIPQVYYCHNVVPTDAGFISTSYLPILTQPADTDGTFSDVFLIRDSANNVGYLCNTSSGRNYIFTSTSSGWLRTTDKAPAAGKIVSTAYVNGVTYIYFGGVGCYKYNFATNTLDAVALTALTAANIGGVTAAFGYLIAWTDTNIAWSSTIDPTDFTPSLVTGAGGGPVQQIKGPITVCAPHGVGFIIYTKANNVCGFYTGNSQLPFTFKELVASGGVSNFSMVAFDANSTDHWAYTTSGLQAINPQQTQVVFPQVTDFLAGSQFEDFDEQTMQFTLQVLGTPMKKKLTSISDRYLVISYGVNSLTHALLYDFALGRWGKLKFAHVDCFEYIAPSPDVVETPRRSIGFIDAYGNVSVLAMSYDTAASQGLLIAGKYQHDRNYYIELQEIHFENVKAGANFNVRVLSSLNGTTTTSSVAALAEAAGLYRRYNVRKSGVNHSLILQGGFHASSMELKFIDAGRVR